MRQRSSCGRLVSRLALLASMLLVGVLWLLLASERGQAKAQGATVAGLLTQIAQLRTELREQEQLLARAVHEQHTAEQESADMRRYKEELLPACQRAKSTVQSAEAKALKVRVFSPYSQDRTPCEPNQLTHTPAAHFLVTRVVHSSLGSVNLSCRSAAGVRVAVSLTKSCLGTSAGITQLPNHKLTWCGVPGCGVALPGAGVGAAQCGGHSSGTATAGGGARRPILGTAGSHGSATRLRHLRSRARSRPPVREPHPPTARPRRLSHASCGVRRPSRRPLCACSGYGIV